MVVGCVAYGVPGPGSSARSADAFVNTCSSYLKPSAAATCELLYWQEACNLLGRQARPDHFYTSGLDVQLHVLQPLLHDTARQKHQPEVSCCAEQGFITG